MPDLGEPQHYSYCHHCERNIGGPYFDKAEARARRKEHLANLHEAGMQGWTPSPRAMKRRGADMGGALIW